MIVHSLFQKNDINRTKIKKQLIVMNLSVHFRLEDNGK